MKILKLKSNKGKVYPALYIDALKRDKIIIHIHGMAGSPIWNDFINPMIEKYSQNGWSFIVPEHSGTGVLVQRVRNNEVINDGTTYEIFEDCIDDIDTWVNYALSQGYKEIWLSGHSLGVNKVTYYALNTRNKIAGLILISPPDMCGYKNFGVDKEYNDKYMNLAKHLVNEGKGTELLPYFEDAMLSLSAATYISLRDNPNIDIYHYYDERMLDKLYNVKIPVFVCGGTNDFAILSTTTIEKWKKSISDGFKNSERLEVKIYDSDHSFDSVKNELVEDISSFLDK